MVENNLSTKASAAGKRTRSSGSDYFEVFGDVTRWLNIFKIALALSLALNIFLVLLLRRTAAKLPMIIRVDAFGNPAIVESMGSRDISPQEVQNFITYFIEYWRGWDFYKYDDNFTRVWTMMTASMQSNSGKYLDENKVVDRIRREKLRYRVTLTEIRITSSGKEYIVVEVTGTRNEGNYKTDDSRDVRFIGTLVLSIVPRRVSVWGLLADSYLERAFD